MTEPLASVHVEALMPDPSDHTCLPAFKNTFLLEKGMKQALFFTPGMEQTYIYIYAHTYIYGCAYT